MYLCLDGDTDAFGRLVEHYQGAVFATAYYYVGRHGAAEDVAQDAFFQAYRNLRRLNDPHSFGPWLREITSRTAANWLRKHAKRLNSETPLPYKRPISIEDHRQGPASDAERTELYDRIQRAVDTLPERYRLPVVLRFLQELSYEEISEFTGESQEEIRGILQQAVRKLRDSLQDEGKGESNWFRVRK
ncbi:MAG: sigma-70 family RNA polymerase sigma factor [Candidatus Hydrogenedentes bacterium]|nr:sigma-70 family RNA polymerase sigma factor [Candidatus Hydrogenedentota bacterium]